jgi:hypothetical protein
MKYRSISTNGLDSLLRGDSRPPRKLQAFPLAKAVGVPCAYSRTDRVRFSRMRSLT